MHMIPSRDTKRAMLILYFIGNRHNNISNVYRICASVKVGECVDESSGFIYNQVRSWTDRDCGHPALSNSDADHTPFQRKKYYNGLGSENNIAWLKRLETGAFGSGFSDQIREVYKVRLRSPTETP